MPSEKPDRVPIALGTAAWLIVGVVGTLAALEGDTLGFLITCLAWLCTVSGIFALVLIRLMP